MYNGIKLVPNIVKKKACIKKMTNQKKKNMVTWNCLYIHVPDKNGGYFHCVFPYSVNVFGNRYLSLLIIKYMGQKCKKKRGGLNASAKSIDSVSLRSPSRLALAETFLYCLTHFQTTNFRLFQTERVCRRQFQI